MAARFPWGKQPEFPVHCIGTRTLSNLKAHVDQHASSMALFFFSEFFKFKNIYIYIFIYPPPLWQPHSIFIPSTVSVRATLLFVFLRQMDIYNLYIKELYGVCQMHEVVSWSGTDKSAQELNRRGRNCLGIEPSECLQIRSLLLNHRAMRPWAQVCKLNNPALQH